MIYSRRSNTWIVIVDINYTFYFFYLLSFVCNLSWNACMRYYSHYLKKIKMIPFAERYFSPTVYVYRINVILYFSPVMLEWERWSTSERYCLPINFYALQSTIRGNFCSAVHNDAHNDASTRDCLQSCRLFVRTRREQTMLARRLFAKGTRGELLFLVSRTT